MWRSIVNVNGAAEKIYYFREGESVVGDRLAESDDPDLETLFNHPEPAHIECLFNYSEAMNN